MASLDYEFGSELKQQNKLYLNEQKESQIHTAYSTQRNI